MSRRPYIVQGEPAADSYLESLSDLLIGLLFIFIIVLMSFSLNLRIAQDAHKKAEHRLADAAQLRNELLNDLRHRMSRRGIFVEVDKRNGILRLPESLLFSTGSAEFSAEGRESIGLVARELQDELPCYSYGKMVRRSCPEDAHPVLDAVFIEGHTDNVPITGGPYKDNWDLSAARSRNTYQALVDGAPGLTSIHNVNGQPLLSISAYGASRPLGGYGSELQNQKHSRRIDLRFIIATPKLDDLKV